MEDLIIRQSRKTLTAYYLLAIALIAASVIASYQFIQITNWWIGILPSLGFLLGVTFRHMSILMSKIVISNDRLRHESGFISKSTHTIDLVRVQDVRVDQSVRQRLLGTGRISVETSGGSSAIAMDDVDSPHKLADMILERSRQIPHHLT